QVYASSAACRFEVPIRACGRHCRNFKSAALAYLQVGAGGNPRFGCEGMTSLPEGRLDGLVARHQVVAGELSAGPHRDSYVKLSRELSELRPLGGAGKAYRGAAGGLSALDALIDDPQTGADMRRRAHPA